MLKYSKGQKISSNLTLINNDGSPESDADVTWDLYDDGELLLSRTPVYNEQLGSYIVILDPSTEWSTQQEGVYYIKWNISNTVEEYPNVLTEELHIHDYDNKLDRILGLVHDNMLIDNPVYDRFDNLQQARLRLYSDSESVGTDNNVIGEYEIYSEANNVGKFNYWLQKRS